MARQDDNVPQRWIGKHWQVNNRRNWAGEDEILTVQHGTS